MGHYALADHVFVCVDEEYVVVLDLKEDRYYALEAAKSAPLGRLVQGWPVGGEELAHHGPGAQTSAAAVVDLFRERRLLADEPAQGKDATPVRPLRPSGELTPLHEVGVASRLPIGALTIFRFIAASLTAKLALRFLPFERVIRRVRERKRVRERSTQRLDPEQARKLVDTYMHLRVFLFSSREECLYDSLSLLEFLARHDLFPDWVFAVRARPFAAHCWVQHADIVFNDTVEHVGGYTPIMVA